MCRLAETLRPVSAVFVTDVSGVYSGPPEEDVRLATGHFLGGHSLMLQSVTVELPKVQKYCVVSVTPEKS